MVGRWLGWYRPSKELTTGRVMAASKDELRDRRGGWGGWGGWGGEAVSWCEVLGGTRQAVLVPEWLTISSSGRLAAVRPQRATLSASTSSDGFAAEKTASRNPDVQSSELLPPPKRAVPDPPDSAPDKYVTPVTHLTRARASVARGMAWVTSGVRVINRVSRCGPVLPHVPPIETGGSHEVP